MCNLSMVQEKYKKQLQQYIDFEKKHYGINLTMEQARRKYMSAIINARADEYERKFNAGTLPSQIKWQKEQDKKRKK